MTDLVQHLPGFLAAYAILFVAATSPGPAVALLLGIGATQGRAAALVTTTGIALGSVILNVGTLLGVGLLLSEAAWAMSGLRFLGAAYLIWLAWGAFRRAASPPDIAPVRAAPRRPWRLFTLGLGLQVTNPKVIVFWLAIASIGATEGGGPGVVAAFLAGAFAISFACHAAWALLLSSRPMLAAYRAARRRVEAGLGVFFCFAGYKLATSES